MQCADLDAKFVEEEARIQADFAELIAERQKEARLRLVESHADQTIRKFKKEVGLDAANRKQLAQTLLYTACFVGSQRVAEEAFLHGAKLGALDPWRSALAFEEKDHNSIQGSRAMPVAEYFKENPLEWKQNWTLSAETFQTLCAVGYTEHGECKEWRRRALPGFETADASEPEEEVALEEISFPEMRRASGAGGGKSEGQGPTQRETRPGTATNTPQNAADTARAPRAARRRKIRRANPTSPP